MDGKFVRKRFSEIDLNDPFFDSLKEDYPGTPTSKEFAQWFNEKAAEGKKALVFQDDQGVGAFVNLKPGEVEEIMLANGTSLPATSRLKITTIKIDDRYRNQRIGEGALGLTLWRWRDLGTDQIYLTVFEKHASLIFLLEKYGFSYVGDNLNGERVYMKDRNYIDFSDPCKSFPFLSNNIDHAGCLAIEMDYHDTMFASSELANTLQERVDINVANGLKKVYIGSPYNLGFNAGDPVLIYRKYTGSQGKPGYKSCITTYCIATRVDVVKSNGRALISYNDYRRIIGNKSVYDDHQLTTKYDTLSNLTIIELLYYGYFGAGNNVNWVWLKNHGCWPDMHPMSFRYSRDQFETILKEGKIDVANVIVD
jgi:hypothetical protein